MAGRQLMENGGYSLSLFASIASAQMRFATVKPDQSSLFVVFFLLEYNKCGSFMTVLQPNYVMTELKSNLFVQVLRF